MKITFQVLLGLALMANCALGDFQERIFTQKLMPIDLHDTRTWENRYYIDDSYYQPGGPLFVYTSASVNLDYASLMNHTYFFDLGKEFNAILLFTEHRFYGESRPTP